MLLEVWVVWSYRRVLHQWMPTRLWKLHNSFNDVFFNDNYLNNDYFNDDFINYNVLNDDFLPTTAKRYSKPRQ